MGIFDFLEDVGKAVINAGSTVVDAAEDVGKAVTGVATTVAKPLVDAAAYGVKGAMKVKGGAAIARAVGNDGGPILGGAANALDHGRTIAEHARPSRPPKTHQNSGKPTKQHVEVLPNGSTVPSQPPRPSNPPGCPGGGRRLANGDCKTVDKGPFNGGKSKEKKLTDVEEGRAWHKKHEALLAKIIELTLDKYPQTGDPPTLDINNKASRDAYLSWAKEEIAHHDAWQSKQYADEVIKRKKKKLINKIKSRCESKFSDGLEAGTKTLDELTVLLQGCSGDKIKKDFEKAEVTKKAAIKKSADDKAKTKKEKADEAAAKAAAVKKADEAGITRDTIGNSSEELLAEIAKKQKYPMLSKRIYEYFNKNHVGIDRFLRPFFGSVKGRKERLKLDAENNNISVEEMLETWSGDYVSKMVNDYLKQNIEKDTTGQRTYKYAVETKPLSSPPPSNIPYTEKMRKLIIRARKMDKHNMPIKYLGMKLKDNKFLKAPRVNARIGSKAKLAKEDADLKTAKEKDAAANKVISDAKKKEVTQSNKEVKAAEDVIAGVTGKAEAATAAAEAALTENQQLDPNRNFIADPLKSGDKYRYILSEKKNNQDYAIDSLLAHLAYRASPPATVLGEWVYKPTYSTSETKIFYSKKQNKVKLAFKGTGGEQSSWSTFKEMAGPDLFSIALSASATNALGVDYHFQRAIKVYNKARAKYPLAEFSFTGHSLGGRTAIVVADYEQTRYGQGEKLKGTYRKSHVSSFATGSGLETFFRSIGKNVDEFKKQSGGKWQKPNVDMYRVDQDPLSKADSGSKHDTTYHSIPKQASKCGAHTVLNYIHKDFWTKKELNDCAAVKKTMRTPTTTTTTTRSANPYSNPSTTKPPKKNVRGGKRGLESSKKEPTGDYGETFYGKPDV
jgi:hypothetical protein